MKIVLASKSPRRKVLLEQLGLQFDVIPSNVDEKQVEWKEPMELVKKLAEMKADAVAKHLDGDSVVIGADSIVCFEGKIIGQPGDEEEARKTLRMLSGKPHEVFTGFCIINTMTGERMCDSARSDVTIRELSEKDINKCLEHKVILGGAGSYTPEIWPRIFQKIGGSYTNILGLPTEKIIPVLRSQGIDV